MFYQQVCKGSAVQCIHWGITGYVACNPLPFFQWYWVVMVYQHVAKSVQQAKANPDVQHRCIPDVQWREDPSHCLRDTIDVRQHHT